MPKKPKLPKLALPKSIEEKLAPAKKLRARSSGVDWVRNDSTFTKDVQLGEKQKHERDLTRQKFKQDSTLLAMQLEIAKMNARAATGQRGTQSVDGSGKRGGNVTVVGGDPSKVLSAGKATTKALLGKGAKAALFLSQFTPAGRVRGVIASRVAGKLAQAVPVRALLK